MVFLYTPGDTVEPDPTHRPVQDPEQLRELLSLQEQARTKPLKRCREETTPDTLPETFAILPAPFWLINQVMD